MDHVLIDLQTHRMIGRGHYAECLKVFEELGEQFRYQVVCCNEAKGFAVYPQEMLERLWLAATGFTIAPLIQYSMWCTAMQKESQKVGPLSVAMSQLLTEENEMSNVAEQNGVKWPQRGASARVFEIAQEISTQKQNFADKEEVVAKAVAEGINAGTAGTQYSAWLRYWQGPTAALAAEPVPVAPVAPQAPVAPIAPATVQAVQEVMHAHQAQQPHAPVAPQAFTPPTAPAFAAPVPAAPVHTFQAPVQASAVAPSQPFAQPAVAQEVAVAGMPEAEQGVAVNVGFAVTVDMTPAITKLEKLLQTLKDAQADFGG